MNKCKLHDIQNNEREHLREQPERWDRRANLITGLHRASLKQRIFFFLFPRISLRDLSFRKQDKKGRNLRKAQNPLKGKEELSSEIGAKVCPRQSKWMDVIGFQLCLLMLSGAPSFGLFCGYCLFSCMFISFPVFSISLFSLDILRIYLFINSCYFLFIYLL